MPNWLAKYVALMLRHERNRLAGPVISCEKDAHIQGWAQLYDTRIWKTVSHHFKTTCEPEISWEKAIECEISFSKSILDDGFYISGIYPPFDKFSEYDRQMIENGNNKLRNRFDGCANVLLADNLSRKLGSLSDIVLYKFGGDVWRRKLFAQDFVDRIQAETKRLMNSSITSTECDGGFNSAYTSTQEFEPLKLH